MVNSYLKIYTVCLHQELAEEQIQRARKTNGNGNGGHLGNGVHHVDFDDLKRELTHVQTQLQAAQKVIKQTYF